MIAVSTGREPRQAAVEDQVAGVLVVVVVVDRHADVVQHAGRPQQFPLAGVALVQAERGQLVEHAQRQRRHVLGVGRVDGVLAGEVEHARVADVLEHRRSPVAARGPPSRRSKKTPSRRPASVTSSDSKPPASSTPWTTIAPARIRSARAGLIPGMLARSRAGSSASLRDQLLQRLALDHHPLDADRRQTGGPLRRRGEVADGAPEAHQPPPCRRRAPQPAGLGELRGDVARAARPAACAWRARWRAGSARSSAPCRPARSRTGGAVGPRPATAASSRRRGRARSPARRVVELTAAR